MSDHDLCEPVQVSPAGAKVRKWTLLSQYHLSLSFTSDSRHLFRPGTESDGQ